MKKLCFILFVTLLMCIPVISILPQNPLVKADTSPPLPQFNYTYVYEITNYLSNLVNTTDHGIEKSRQFATEGERAAAEYLAEEMEEIGLYDPTQESYEFESYRELISDLPEQLPIIKKRGFGFDPMNTKLEIIDRELILHNLSSGNNTEITEYYISPRWNLTRLFVNYPKNTLTHQFEEHDVHIKHPPINKNTFGPENLSWFTEFLQNTSVITALTENLTKNETLTYDFGLYNFLLDQFETYYNFTFENLNLSDTQTWPNGFERFIQGYNYTLIRENQRFKLGNKNWDELFDPMIDILNDGKIVVEKLRTFAHKIFASLWFKLNPEFKGLIEYDFNNDTYDMNKDKWTMPIIWINGSKGKELNNSVNTYRINYTLDQRWNDSVIAYNVIGQLNGTDPSKTILITSLFDSWWNSGSSDSAIGMGIVMAIARYMKELNDSCQIQPQYNIKFVGFCGEEYNLVGARHYEALHCNGGPYAENVIKIIDLNQLGFNLTKMDLDVEDTFTLELWSNKIYNTAVLETIGKRSNYQDRTDGYTTFKANGPLSILQFGQRFINRLDGGRPGNQNIFAMHHPFKCTTIYYLKNGPWRYHHRDGKNHTEGDVLKYYDWKDVNVSAELILNVSKSNCYKNLSSFDENPEFDFWDSNSDGYYDTINVSYDISTDMPEELCTVHLLIYPRFSRKQIGYPLLYRQREQKEHTVTRGPATSGYINVTLNDGFPTTEYIIDVFLTDSVGEAYLDTINSISFAYPGKQFIQGFFEEWNNIRNIWEKLPFGILLKLNDFQQKAGICFWKMMEHQSDIRPIKGIVNDFLGYYIVGNDNADHIVDKLSPPNTPPDTPDISGPLEVHPRKNFRYSAKTTDPDGDAIRFKWNWSDLRGKTWSLQQYLSNEYHYKTHWWTKYGEPTGEFTVAVKACDCPLNPNHHSGWATLIVTMQNGCGFDNVLESPFNPHSTPNQNILLVSQETEFEGETYGIEFNRDIENYTYDFGDNTTAYGQNVSHNYTTTNTYNVTFTVYNGTTNITYYDHFTVVNTSAGFNISSIGAPPNHTIAFTDVSQSIRTIENYSWNFSDGTISYQQNPEHTFQTPGEYNVTLTIRDANNEQSICYLTVYIETTPPTIIDVPYEPSIPCLNDTITLYTDVYDNQSGIKSVAINITRPNGTTTNHTMQESFNSSFDYEYVFNETDRAGWYFYTIWVKDHANNTNYTAGHGINVTHAIGYTCEGDQQKTIMNNITCSNYTMLVNGTADSITAHLQCNNTPAPTTRCMIYRANDSVLIGATEEKTINTGDNTTWIVYNFTGTQPTLIRDTEYVISIWSNSSVNLSYDNTTNLTGRYSNEYTYGASPDPVNWTANETRRYSLYCTYNAYPEITNVYTSPNILGFGYNATIYCDIKDNACGIENVSVNISYPNNTTGNYTMNNTGNTTYQYVFTDTWIPEQYNYTIWVKDGLYQMTNSSGHSFNVSVNATIQVCTIKNNYTGNETINLTDPPTQPITIGHELLDNNQVLHIWNRNDNYYFNTSSGIQLTNHKDKYWSHNVLMLGYYNNNQWNLLYRTDELSGFNNNIETDNQTYINITQWKDLTYQSYDFRLAIRYHLGVNDNELTIIPYIKNLGAHIPYTLGFAWEIQDIQIAMTETDDHLEINGSSYQLNQPMNQTFANMTQPIYGWNTTTNQTYIKDYTPIPYFHIKEYFPNGRSESLYLRWNHTLTYQVNVQSQEGQYNAPITLGIKIGTLQPNQEKQTTLYWHDASQTTYFFRSYDEVEQWTYEPRYMADGSTSTYAYTSQGDIELLDDNSYEENEGTILKVELRTRGYCYGGQRDITLRPVFSGSTDGSNYTFEPSSTGSWSSWYDITTDANAPSTWTWSDISDLECDVEAESGYMFGTSYCAKVELRVTYTDTPPETTSYYFDRCAETETWAEAHEYMVDGNIETFAYTDTKTDVELLDTNTCTVEDTGEVYKVEIRALGHHGEENGNISLRPVFNGTTDGSEYLFYTPLEEPGWSDWFDITNDANAPTNWTWQDVTNLDCDVIAIENESGDSSIDVYCGKVEIRITYVPTNDPPGISNSIPANNTIGVSLTPQISITVSDAEGDSMNITWSSNSSGTWHVFGTNNSVANGTYYQTFSNATENGKWWYWRVNVSDDDTYVVGPTYKFYTGYQSKIMNTGSTNISGYLLMQIHYYNTTSTEWEGAFWAVNETTPRTINASDQLGLDTIFNGLVNTTDLSSFGTGTYRMYAAFQDPYWNVLEVNDSTKLEATYEFTIAFT